MPRRRRAAAETPSSDDGATDADAAVDAGLEHDRRGSHRRAAAKIDRLGPVNMMAIDQFDELETRHSS